MGKKEKYHMRELYVKTQTAEDVDGHTRAFDYYVVVDEMCAGQYQACESYGVKVAEQGGDETIIPNITVDIGRIDGLVGLLTHNLVGPAGLADVISDWL